MNENPVHKNCEQKPVDKRSTYQKVKDIYESIDSAVTNEKAIVNALAAAGRTEPDYMKEHSREKYSYHVARQIAFESVKKIIEPLLKDLTPKTEPVDPKNVKKDA